MEEYRVVEIQGKHGMIYLNIPNRKPTEEDMKELHMGIARATLMDEKFKAQQVKKEAT